MDEQIEGNAEVLDAVNQQKNMINAYLMSKKDVETAPSVIPATEPEKPDLLFKKDFLSAIDDLKRENVNKEELSSNNNEIINQDETQKNTLKELTREEKEELKKEYPEIKFDLPEGSKEDKERELRFDRDLYDSFKERQEKNKEQTKSANKEVEIIQTQNKKETNEPNIDNLDKKIKTLTKGLPEPSSVEVTKNTVQAQPVIDNTPKVSANVDNDKKEQSIKTVLEVNPNTPAEASQPTVNTIKPPEPSLPVSNIREIVKQPTNEKQQNKVVSETTSQQGNTPKEIKSDKVVKDTSIPTNVASKKPIEKNEVTEDKQQLPEAQANVAKLEESSQPIKKPNQPVEDQSSQQPLKVTNYSEVSLDELNKNISSLNNNVNNISNMLANATSILANIASKESGITNNNNIGNSGTQQKQQYQMITGGIEGYRQSFRTPNNPNDILGRPLTPNIPGVSYV